MTLGFQQQTSPAAARPVLPVASGAPKPRTASAAPKGLFIARSAGKSFPGRGFRGPIRREKNGNGDLPWIAAGIALLAVAFVLVLMGLFGSLGFFVAVGGLRVIT